jgi:hypothetical protein
MLNITSFTKRTLIFIIYKVIDIEFFSNNRGLLDTHKKHSKYNESIVWCFFEKIKILGLFDVHESSMTCKCDAM